MKLILGSKQFIKGLNKDYQIEVDLIGQYNEFDEDIITKIIDETVQFKIERDACNNYLLYGKIENLIDESLDYDTCKLNDDNYQISLGYVNEYEALAQFQYQIDGIIDGALLITQDNIFLKDDVVLLYKDSKTIFVKKVLDSQTNKVTIDDIPSGITITDFKLIPAIAQYKRIYKSLYDENYLKFYNSGFSVNIFNDEINQFNSYKNIDLSNLTDIFGLPVVEIILNLKKKSTVLGNHYFSNKLFESNANIVDVVEYDLNNLLLTTVDTTYYDFVNNNTLVDYVYNPWIKIIYKCFSNHIVNVTENTSFDYPDYAFKFSDGDILYKNLLSVGFFEENTNGINYPFINNINYLYNDIKFYIKRLFPIFDYTGLIIDDSDVDYNDNLITSGIGDSRLC